MFSSLLNFFTAVRLIDYPQIRSIYNEPLQIRKFWTYQLAIAGDEIGRECQRYSDFYCLSDWYQSGKISNRQYQDSDFEDIWDLASKVYKKINWFNVGRLGADFDIDCCGWQTMLYMTRGRLYGYSPQEFIDIISDHTEGNKLLSSVSARFDVSACVNVIERIEYGNSPQYVFFTQLSNSSAHMDRPFVVITNAGGNIHLLGMNIHQMVRTLTFRWFKENVMCEEHRELCEIGLEEEMKQMRIN